MSKMHRHMRILCGASHSICQLQHKEVHCYVAHVWLWTIEFRFLPGLLWLSISSPGRHCDPRPKSRPWHDPDPGAWNLHGRDTPRVPRCVCDRWATNSPFAMVLSPKPLWFRRYYFRSVSRHVDAWNQAIENHNINPLRHWRLSSHTHFALALRMRMRREPRQKHLQSRHFNQTSKLRQTSCWLQSYSYRGMSPCKKHKHSTIATHRDWEPHWQSQLQPRTPIRGRSWAKICSAGFLPSLLENNTTLTSSIFLSQVETQADCHDELFDDPVEDWKSKLFLFKSICRASTWYHRGFKRFLHTEDRTEAQWIILSQLISGEDPSAASMLLKVTRRKVYETVFILFYRPDQDYLLAFSGPRLDSSNK